MKEYHSIEYYNKQVMGTNVIVFNKLDGSNLSFEWNRKQSKKGNDYGFTKFGTKKQIIDASHSQYGEDKLLDELNGDITLL